MRGRGGYDFRHYIDVTVYSASITSDTQTLHVRTTVRRARDEYHNKN